MLDFREGVLALAPLAGYTDLPFRALAKKMGAELTISEMVSSNALVYRNKKTLQLIKKSSAEDCFFAQISGFDPYIIKDAVCILNEFPHIKGIDLNCGCPAKKIIENRSGAFLLTNIPLMQKLIGAIKDNSTKKYTSVKIRLGFDRDTCIDTAMACKDAGADFISIHARTAKQGYKGKANYTAIKNVVDKVDINVISNGDITDRDVAMYVREYTNSNSIMIGRASIGNPWIFNYIKQPSLVFKKEKILNYILEHIYNMVSFYGDRGVILFRKHAHAYFRGFKNSSALRNKINKIEDLETLVKLISYFYNSGAIL